MFKIQNLIFQGILDIPFLEIQETVTCLVGTSGSGKTTLLRMLNRLYAPDAGEIFYQDRELGSWDPVALRREVVMLGQTPVIYNGTVEENLQMGRQFSQKSLAGTTHLQKALERVGLEKSLQESCRNFSGGEKQRLCLARVMLMDAPVYLLDEPSAALDAGTEKAVLGSFTEFIREGRKQLVMVTHSETLAKDSGGITIRLEKGKVKEVSGYELGDS